MKIIPVSPQLTRRVFNELRTEIPATMKKAVSSQGKHSAEPSLTLDTPSQISFLTKRKAKPPKNPKQGFDVSVCDDCIDIDDCPYFTKGKAKPPKNPKQGFDASVCSDCIDDCAYFTKIVG